MCGLVERPSFELDKFIMTCKKTRKEELVETSRTSSVNISNVSPRHGDLKEVKHC